MTIALKPSKVFTMLPQFLMQAVERFLVWEVRICGALRKFTIIWSAGRTIVPF
jgi:hypothetical protein